MRNNYSKRQLIDLYKKMLVIRKCEESFVEPILSGEIKCPVHLYSGQEAIAVGMSVHLTDKDIIFGNHRSHGHYLAKGGNLQKMVSEIYCKENGCAKGRGGSMHILDPKVGMLGAAPIVAGTISLTLGASVVLKNKKKGKIAVAYLGDGATGEGTLYESMNFAAMRNLPIIFACENNLYSTHLPIRETRPNVPIVNIGKAFGIKSYQCDGNNVLKTLEVSEKAVTQCREGSGPVLIEFKTYRFRGHVGPSDNIQGTKTDIRPKKEVTAWLKKDPIKRLEKYLLNKNLISVNTLEKINNDIDLEISKAHKNAVLENRPNPKELNNYVFK